ncbi:16S rRNA C967 or C1407 C5-methylase, RsmB/RsmF family [Lachnospiraceae bacterium XBB2008]|nr:16S rRNA C967 or C1407 C5-methylase, RsmB/RsmF family [Lachnospiraceae bacterium XBB2008]
MTGDMSFLPEEYLARMSELLKDEYEDFLSSYSNERTYGLRINPLKVDLNDEDKIKVILTQPGCNIDPEDHVTWCDEGYYYNEDSCPGRSPYHEAGAYYIQEPSAMAVTSLLDPQPGERICDLCAAPGGKTTHIAGRMRGRGVLVANEYVPDRAGILSQNVERMGVSNCLVTCMHPADLSQHFMGYFDKVCVDAPCSGEGMFRKDHDACLEWSSDNVDMCAARQFEILDAASDMVTSGGVIVYSTCTFEPDENERVIETFLKCHPEWTLEESKRIWPHRMRGEGHFAAKLIKTGMSDKSARNEDLKNKNRQLYNEVARFLHTELGFEISDNRIIYENKDHIYMLPDGISEQMLRGLRVIRPGIELVTRHKDRFEPAHSLAMSLRPDEVQNVCDLTYDNAVRYLMGETVNVNDNGCNSISGPWTLMTINGISFSWGKKVGETIKNHYPKGLRRDVSIKG